MKPLLSPPGSLLIEVVPASLTAFLVVAPDMSVFAARCRSTGGQAIEWVPLKSLKVWIHLYRDLPIMAADGSSVTEKLQRDQKTLERAAYPEFVLYHGVVVHRGGLWVLLLDDRGPTLLAG